MTSQATTPITAAAVAPVASVVAAPGGTAAGDLPAMARRINTLHESITGALRLSLDHAIEIGGILTQIKAAMPHGAFMPWLESNVAFTDRTARRYMAVHDGRDRLLKSDTVSDLKSAYRMLAAHDESAGTESTEAEPVKPHVANNGGDNEWYTPEPYAVAARTVMGGVDLDPASTPEANAVIQANRIFTRDMDGLTHDWSGRVFLNPPYAADLVGRFVEKLVAAYESGSITEAVVLVNNATDTRWFARLASVSAMLCFPTGRVKFWHPRKEATPLQGQAVAYIGSNGRRFGDTFKKFGIVTQVLEPGEGAGS